MKCHKCKHNAEIARLRDICSKCELGDKCAVSDSVSLDTIHDGTLDRVVRVAPNHQTAYTFDPGTIDEPADAETSERDKTWDAMTTLLACIAAIPFEDFKRLMEYFFTAKSGKIEFLTKTEFQILAHLLNGGTMIEYAEADEETKQTAFARIKSLFNSRPIFRAIANGGLTRGKGGRVATPRPNYQLDFFDSLGGC